MVTNGRSYGILSLSFSVGQLDLPGVKTKEQLATAVAQRISLTLTNLRIKEQRKASTGHSRSRNP